MVTRGEQFLGPLFVHNIEIHITLNLMPKPSYKSKRNKHLYQFTSSSTSLPELFRTSHW